MKLSLRKIIDAQLKVFLLKKLKAYKLSKIDPVLASSIKEFVLRDGKRIRPVFFLLSFLGFSKKKRLTADVIRCAVAFELLHDFLLIHDDIIDNSPLRRGKPTLHRFLEKRLHLTEKNSWDLGIIAGDIVFALAIDAFLGISVSGKIKEDALREFLKSTVLTGAGEFKDVLNGLTPMRNISLSNIRLNYLLKTAEYTFKAPLVCASMLAGAGEKNVQALSAYASLLGEAFQIQDDLIGIFADSKKIGKSVLSDISEAKKTLPVFIAYGSCTRSQRKFIDFCLGNSKLRYHHLQKIRQIIKHTGAYDKSRLTIKLLLKKANAQLAKTQMDKRCQEEFRNYTREFIPA